MGTTIQGQCGPGSDSNKWYCSLSRTGASSDALLNHTPFLEWGLTLWRSIVTAF